MGCESCFQDFPIITEFKLSLWSTVKFLWSRSCVSEVVMVVTSIFTPCNWSVEKCLQFFGQKFQNNSHNIIVMSGLCYTTGHISDWKSVEQMWYLLDLWAMLILCFSACNTYFMFIDGVVLVRRICLEY